MKSYVARLQLSNILEYLHPSDKSKLHEEIKGLYDFFNEMDEDYLRSIRWSVEDFQGRAEQIYGEKWDTTYDENKFEEALHAMIQDHDANYGITWKTLDHYLDTYCAFK